MRAGAAAGCGRRADCGAIVPLQHPGRFDQAREEAGSWGQIATAPEFGIYAGQEVVEMRSNKTSELQEHGVRPAHEKGGSHHAKGNKLSGDSEEEKASLLPSCVLGGGVSHCQDQS